MALASIPPAIRPLNVLVFSPTPTHPAIQGNRQRVSDICRAMQSIGAELTLLYYATESITSSDVRQMRAAWGDVEIVFPRGLTHGRSLVRYPAIDDWYDESITTAALGLCSGRRFDVCIVNYVWYSKFFEALADNVVRVIDTHDLFGGRADEFTDIGLDPSWFHTSVEQEAIGLDRADFVLAIQDVEARALQARTRSPVRSVGRLSPGDFLPLRNRGPAERLSVGYVGSGNPFNVASMLAFAETVRARPEVWETIEIQVAGPICEALSATPPPFRLRGVVDSISEFYRSVDVMINPMLGGTGLKIKSLEALGFGKPLVATADAMAGIATDHTGHMLSSPSTLLDYIITLADQPARLGGEAAVARQVYHTHQQAQTQAFRETWSEIVAAVEARSEAPDMQFTSQNGSISDRI